MRSTANLILTLGLTATVAAACSESGGMPTEPLPSGAISAPTGGPSADLLELPTDLISDIVKDYELVQTVNLVSVAIPTSGRTAEEYNNGTHSGGGTNETTNDSGMSLEQRTNECTGEDVVINFKFHTTTHTKTYRDGSQTTTVHDQRNGEGYAIAGFDVEPPFDPIPTDPVVEYFGNEHTFDFTWSREEDQVQYTDRFLHLDREGNDPRYDDMILHTIVAYWIDDGQMKSRVEYAKLKCH